MTSTNDYICTGPCFYILTPELLSAKQMFCCLIHHLPGLCDAERKGSKLEAIKEVAHKPLFQAQ